MESIKSYFESVTDFRIEKKCQHKLSEILTIGLLTYLSNGEDYEDMVLFGNTHEAFLREFLELENGIPSHDTFNSVFSILDPAVLGGCLEYHGREVLDILSQRQICFDGKKLKGANPKTRGNAGLYIVNAWVSENKLCIGQKKVDDKSNEITAIPALLAEINIEDAVVSIDAIGCQREIVESIIDKKGHYLLALKGNQEELLTDVESGFKACRADSVSEEWEYDHGRYETRKCSILRAEHVLLKENLSQWKGLKTLVKIEATRQVKETQSKETRYYISDEENLSVGYFNMLVRGHWGIENHLHWHLDVTFREDACRVRKGYAAENLSSLRKLALQIIREDDSKLSLKKRRLKAAYDLNYLKKLIT